MPEIVQDYLAQYEEMVTDADSFDAWKEKMKEERGQRDDVNFFADFAFHDILLTSM